MWLPQSYTVDNNCYYQIEQAKIDVRNAQKFCKISRANMLASGIDIHSCAAQWSRDRTINQMSVDHAERTQGSRSPVMASRHCHCHNVFAIPLCPRLGNDSVTGRRENLMPPRPRAALRRKLQGMVRRRRQNREEGSASKDAPPATPARPYAPWAAAATAVSGPPQRSGPPPCGP